jgi:hypothetical protein
MAIIKGSKAIQLVRQEYRYDPQQQTNVIEREYQGSTLSALGFYTKTAGGQNNVSVQLDGGVGRVVVQSPVGGSKSGEEYTEKYEVVTEFVEKEIWQIPDVAQEARQFNQFVDDNGDVDDPYYKELAEQVASNKLGVSVSPVTYPLFQQVVRYLRDGVTGYELEYVVIKRSRRIPRGTSQVAAIGDGLVYYTTGQLLLPDDISFSVPDSTTLTPISDDYAWGWRRRPSQSVVEGMYMDQSSEFILSQWSTLAYTPAGGNAAW